MSDSDITRTDQTPVRRQKWTIHVSFEGSEDIEQAMKDAGFSSGDLRKDVQDFMGSSVALLVRVIDELKKGNKIASVDEKNDKYTEFTLPFRGKI